MNEQPFATGEPTLEQLRSELYVHLLNKAQKAQLITYNHIDERRILDSYNKPFRTARRLSFVEDEMVKHDIVPVCPHWIDHHEGIAYQVQVGQKNGMLKLCSIGAREVGGIADFQQWNFYV